MEIRVKIDSAEAQRAFKEAPLVMERTLERYLDRAGLEVAREARSAAPKAFSTLVQSIRSVKTGLLKREVAPGVSYGAFVEAGRGPGRQPGTRNGLMDWVKFRTGAAGKELERKTFLIARGIARRGIKAQPYMQPTFEKMEPRVHALLDEGVAAGLREVFSA